jgi:hypothetical protein
VLVEDGLLTEDQLDAALENQVRTRRLLGDILVELGYVSSGEVERALAIQAGVATADGIAFGTGLRSELERRADVPAAPVLHLVETPAVDPEPVGPDLGHVLMVQRSGGYALVDREGAAPVPGTVLELPEGGAFRVETVGSSPYPDDPRRCAFALPVRELAV